MTRKMFVSFFNNVILPFIREKIPALFSYLRDLINGLTDYVTDRLNSIIDYCHTKILGIFAKYTNQESHVDVKKEIYTIKDDIITEISTTTKELFSKLSDQIQKFLHKNDEVVIDAYSPVKEEIRNYP